MTPDLVPLAYHLETADRLRALEPQAWAVFARAAGHAVPATGSATVNAVEVAAATTRHGGVAWKLGRTLKVVRRNLPRA